MDGVLPHGQVASEPQSTSAWDRLVALAQKSQVVVTEHVPVDSFMSLAQELRAAMPAGSQLLQSILHVCCHSRRL